VNPFEGILGVAGVKIEDRVEKIIDKVRPAFGVNIVELVTVRDGVVEVRVIPSACAAGIRQETVLLLLEEQIKEEMPEIKEVVAVEA
jgi:Fe-S cluster biogenesis protein NfuA